MAIGDLNLNTLVSLIQAYNRRKPTRAHLLKTVDGVEIHTYRRDDDTGNVEEYVYATLLTTDVATIRANVIAARNLIDAFIAEVQAL